MVARYTESELWQELSALFEASRPFYSGTKGKAYFIDSIDETTKMYTVRYERGNLKQIPLHDLYAIYVELYRLGTLPRDYLKDSVNG